MVNTMTTAEDRAAKQVTGVATSSADKSTKNSKPFANKVRKPFSAERKEPISDIYTLKHHVLRPVAWLACHRVKPGRRLFGRVGSYHSRNSSDSSESVLAARSEALQDEIESFMLVFEQSSSDFDKTKFRLYSNIVAEDATLAAEIAQVFDSAQSEESESDDVDEADNAEETDNLGDVGNNEEPATCQDPTNPEKPFLGLDQDLPPLCNINNIFEDLVGRAWNEPSLSLSDMQEYLGRRKLRIGTVCSGTESPILALDLLNDGKISHS